MDRFTCLFAWLGLALAAPSSALVQDAGNKKPVLKAEVLINAA